MAAMAAWIVSTTMNLLSVYGGSMSEEASGKSCISSQGLR